ncbi:hypothetical protein BSL78_04460 [Apostichopus japonicus]|uniref:Uncharacterized protein n=1 Tax=Stichopus japonicus TaxID=307972 RepID=A0A2G8LEH9_STIJA|nr:hypothetical protein BSL78_04460 [Apostichopus japonicus]
MNATITNYSHEPHNVEHEDVSSICPVDLMTTSTCGRIKSSEDKIIFGPGFSCANSLTKDVKHEEFLETDEFKPRSLADQMNESKRGLPLNRGIPNEPHASHLAKSMPDYRVNYITLDHGDNHNKFQGIHKQDDKTVYATITHNDKIVQRQQGLETSSE